MPYCFAEGDPGWDELAEEHALRPAQFRYLPPPDVGGLPDPVRFSDKPPSAAATLEPVVQSRSFLDRLLGRPPKASNSPSRPTWAQREQEAKRQNERWIAVLTVLLREVGVRRVYCRYDGGNDEGFAWLDHAELKTGERLSSQALGARLAEANFIERLVGEELWVRTPRSEFDEMSLVRDAIAIEFACKLLGSGYGTGSYWLYGAFTVDLDACTIVDDRKAEPVVENINLEA